jgi:predicted regulator of amino acid metabolism with ACT domain
MSLVEWSAIVSNFAQVVGATAVVATLVYLSAQVKQNTEAIQCTNATTVQINFQNLARDLSTDRELSDVIVRAIKGEQDLTQAEKPTSFHAGLSRGR